MARNQNVQDTGQLTADQRKKLRGFVEEIERYEDEIDRMKLDVKGAYEAAVEAGLDAAAIKKAIQLRKKTPEKLEQLDLFEQTVATYRAVVSQPDKPARSLMIDRPFAPPLDA